MVEDFPRTAVKRLVREFLELDRADRRWPPILLLAGSKGCGKTETFKRLAAEMAGRIPYSRIDCAAPGLLRAQPRQVLAALAFDLNLNCGEYRSLSFPRLMTGLIATEPSLQLGGPDADTARAGIRRAIEEYHNVDKLRALLARLAADAVTVIPAVKQVPGAARVAPYVPELLLHGLLKHRWGRRVVLGPGEAWYGHQDQGFTRQPVDALVELNRFAAEDRDKDGQREAAQVLWAAFLADLREDFSGNGNRRLACAVMLDNAEAGAGLNFLEEFEAARGLRAKPGPDVPDPLLVIAASRGPLVARAVRPGREGEVADVRSAGPRDYARACDAGHLVPGRYPVRLPDLAEDEVTGLVRSVELRGVAVGPIGSAIHRFTQGHPGSTYLLIEALANARNPCSLSSMLDEPAPGLSSAGTVGARMLRDLVGTNATVVHDLVVCAAARGLDDATWLAAEGDLVATAPGRQSEEIFRGELWPVFGPDGNAVMLPVLRRLLLRKLADDPGHWTEVFTRLSEHVEKKGANAVDGAVEEEVERGDEGGDENGRGGEGADLVGWAQADAGRTMGEPAQSAETQAYYALALGQASQAADALCAQMKQASTTADAGRWIGTLEAIATAPMRGEYGTWPSPGGLSAAADAVHRLVAALWWAANADGLDELAEYRREAAASLDVVAPSFGQGLPRIRERAEHYRRLADRG